MTEEQIKQKAEEYADKEFGMYQPTDHERYLRTQSFIDGYHECQKEHEWHDLEKDPTDLPKKDKKYVVKVKEYAGISVYIGRYWKKEKIFTGHYLQELDVIKWKEIE